MTDGNLRIETERLILRRHRIADFADLAAVARDPEVRRFLGGIPQSDEDLWNRLLRYEGHWTLLGYGIFAVEEKASGNYLGQVGFADFHRELGPAFDGVPEAAWVLRGAGHGRGVATEAACAARDWLDRVHAPARTVCIIAPENAPSIKVAAKLGYVAFGEAVYHEHPVVMLERRL